MDVLLYLVLELKRVQLQLSLMQSANNTRAEAQQVRPQSAPPVTPVAMRAPSAKAQKSVTPTPLESSEFRIETEALVLQEMNTVRAEFGLSPIIVDLELSNISRAHSADMLSKNYFAHNNLQNCSAACRLTHAGYTWKSYGENIHWMSGFNLSARETAQKIVQNWMNSPPHRANILGAFTYTGVGIAVDGTKIYSTANYTTK